MKFIRNGLWGIATKLVEEVLSAFFRAPVNIRTEVGNVADVIRCIDKSEPVEFGETHETAGIITEDIKVKKNSNAEDALKLFGGKLVDSD